MVKTRFFKLQINSIQVDTRAQESCDQLGRSLEFDMRGRAQKVRMPSEVRIIMKEKYVTTNNNCK
jgi:hypothetical protein